MKHSKLTQRIYWLSAFLALFTCVYLISIIFLNPSSVGNPLFGQTINLWAVIWTVNFLIVLVLAFLLARELIKLFFEYQKREKGSRIKAKLVGSHIVVSLFPALIMSFLALGLINRTLDEWFRSPSRQILQSARQVENSYYRMHRRLGLDQAQAAAERIASGRNPWAAATRKEGVQGLLRLDSEGRIVESWGEWATPQSPEEARTQVAAALAPLRKSGEFYSRSRSSQADSGLGGSTTHDFGWIGWPLESGEAIFLRFVMPDSAEFHRIGVQEGFSALDAIQSDDRALRIAYFSVLGLSTVAVVFGFVWLAAYTARRITAPIEALARGSRELAQGNLDHRVETEAGDELGVLVDSFNSMAEQLRENRQQLEKANAELQTSNDQLDERRRYIETILQNIATGVVSIDRDETVRSVNDAALKMFQVSRERVLHRPIKEFSAPVFYQEFQRLKKRALTYGAYRRELVFRSAGRQLHIAATITLSAHQDSRGLEYLVVLDDLTELIQAEKFAAWQEVAQRLAHEIKNPLTPIQLSAERVHRRFQRLTSNGAPNPVESREFGKVLQDATEIIVAETEMLKSLVAEFTRFARLPSHDPQPVHLHDLIDRTLTLYDGGLSGVEVVKSFDPELEQIPADPDQMQRVFINLIDNSLDALADNSNGRRLEIETLIHPSRRSARLRFSDNGCGILPDDYQTLFLPYFSTKKKGTGLGLAIVRQIIDEHQGSIRAEPNAPDGTSFIIDLPMP